MKGIKQIFNKEITRIVKDKKMLFSIFFLPVVLMVGIMTLTNTMMKNMTNDIKSHVPSVYVKNMPQSFESYLKAGGYDYEIHKTEDTKKVRDALKTAGADFLVEFPEGFEEAVENYTEGMEVPQIKTYYNPSEDYSSAAYRDMETTLETYRQMLLKNRVGNLEQIQVFKVNSDNPDMIVQDEKKADGKALGMMLPYFITVLLFAGAMGIGTDMIAGEKERGTMASLLVSPVKRSSIVLGKVFALMVISGISSVIYVVVMFISMPLMAESMTGQSGAELAFRLDPLQGLMLAGVLIALAFLYATLIALFSVFAKSTKEANSYVMPAYILVLALGLMSMFTSGQPSQEMYYIPLYNSTLVLKGILANEVTMAQYMPTLLITLGLGALLTVVIVKAFEKENVMAP